MKINPRLLPYTLIVSLLGASPAPIATAVPAAQVDIATVTCGDLKQATPLDRSAIVMFYWGYEAAKANAKTFKTGLIENATARLMTECASNSKETILQAMQRIDVKAF
jgi:hypothetical protein